MQFWTKNSILEKKKSILDNSILDETLLAKNQSNR